MSFKGVRYLGIDEISVRKGHKYLTIVMDPERGNVIYAGDGKEADALSSFWKCLGKYSKNIMAVSTDMSPAYISAVLEHLPGVPLVFDLIANIEKMPLDFTLTGGQVNDAKEGYSLIKRNDFRMKYLLADNAYDTDKIRGLCASSKTETCIPPKSNRKCPAEYNLELYRERRIIENMFGRLKDWRGIAMRFCRCAHTFDSFVCLALIQIFFYVR